MLKVAIFLRHVGPYHHARLEALTDLGVIVKVLTFGDTGGVAYDEHVGNLNYDLISTKRYSRGLFNFIAGYLDEVKPDVLVVPGWAEPEALWGLSLALDRGIPTIVMSDSQAKNGPTQKWKECLKGRIVRLFSAALVAGRNHIEYLAKLGMPVNKIFNGVDVVDNEYFRNGAAAVQQDRNYWAALIPGPHRFFLASNRFLAGKNLSGIVHAYARYRRVGAPGDWGLVLLGDGPEKETIISQCDTLGIERHVIFSGMRPYSDLPIFYGLGGCFVHASFEDTWGLVINEAMASGLPVVVSEACGCVPDLVHSGLNGFSFDPANIDDLANYMIKIASGECDLEAMGRASQEIISHWTPAVFAQNLFRAAEVALACPLPKKYFLDRMMLWGLARKLQVGGRYI